MSMPTIPFADDATANCAGCHKPFPFADLDPLLLDEERGEVSTDLFCQGCFGTARVVESDRWRPL